MRLKTYIKCFIGKIQCWINKIPYSPGVYIGKGVHVVNGKNIQLGRNVQIRPNVDLFAGSVFQIKDGCDIGTRNRIVGNIVLEEKVLLGPDNYICSEDHSFLDITIPIMDQGTHFVNNNDHSELLIGKGSWIGTHVAIIGDVHIGKNCVVGANSVVTKDIPDYCVAVGIPAKVVKQYNMETGQWEKVGR